MCGISGYFRLPGSSFKNHKLFLEFFESVNDAIYERGPDCFGVFGVDDQGHRECLKADLRVPHSPGIHHRAVQAVDTGLGHAALALCNFRGVPTTEYIVGGDPTLSIQPYMDGKSEYIVTHNGQLSNDKELIKKHKYHHYTDAEHDIDSYYFINLVKKADHTPIYLRQTVFGNDLHKIEGSYALAGFNCPMQQLYFARDFKGLYFAVWEHDGDRYLVYSSEAKSFENPCEQTVVVREFPLYSALTIRLEELWFTPESPPNEILDWICNTSFPIRHKTEINERSAAVVLSGGMDSTVCATLACAAYKRVHLLHFMYGARAQEKEIAAVQAITKFLIEKFPQVEIVLKFVDLDFIKKLGGSTLTEHDKQIAHGELGVETDHEWVPARNIAMIGLATSYCDRHDIGNIILGLNMEEGGVFSDNSVEFYEQMERALQLGSKARPKLVMPVGKMMKRHIAAKGMEIDAPLHLSWSCYEGKDIRCGVCGPCVMRQRAFAMNGVKDDKVTYAQFDAEAERILDTAVLDTAGA